MSDEFRALVEYGEQGSVFAYVERLQAALTAERALRQQSAEEIIEVDEDGKVHGEVRGPFRDPGCTCNPYDCGATRGRDAFCPVHGRVRR